MATATAVPGTTIIDTWEMPEQISLWQDSWRRLRRNKLAIIGLVIVVIAVLSAVVSPFWTPYETWRNALGPTYAPPSLAHPLGLDNLGRDVLSRLMSGATVALTVGVGATALASSFGIVLGLIAGFYRGKVDAAISTFINVFYGVPDLLVAMTLVVLIGRGVINLVVAIAVTGWLGMARLVRGQTLSLREREFNEAARASGTKNMGIIFKHILPNALGPIIVQATYLVPAAIIFEAFLSLLGLGVPPPTPSWGDMASEGYKSLQFAPHVVLAPSIAISLTVLAFNWLGDGLRDAIDPRMRR